MKKRAITAAKILYKESITISVDKSVATGNSGIIQPDVICRIAANGCKIMFNLKTHSNDCTVGYYKQPCVRG